MTCEYHGREYQVLIPEDPAGTAQRVIALREEGGGDDKIFEQLAEELLDYFARELAHFPYWAVMETCGFISVVLDEIFMLGHKWPSFIVVKRSLLRAAEKFGPEVFGEMEWHIRDAHDYG